MMNFKLFNEMWKKLTDQHDLNVGQRKKSEFPTGVEFITTWALGQAGALSTELGEPMEIQPHILQPF